MKQYAAYTGDRFKFYLSADSWSDALATAQKQDPTIDDVVLVQSAA